ncbi:MAG: hypothetical protein AAF699_14920 [Pseudomonadota bacterium]
MTKHILKSLVLATAVSVMSAQAATLLVANKSEASVSLYRLPEGEKVATLGTDEGPHEIAISLNGEIAVVTNYGTRQSAGNTLTVIEVPTARILRTIDLAEDAMPHGIKWLGEEIVAVTAEGVRALLLVNINTGETVKTIGTDQDISHMLALSQDHDRAFVANIGSGTATVIDLEEAKALVDLAAGAGSEGIAVVRGGSELWVTNREAGSISIFSIESLEKLVDIPLSGFPIRAEPDDERGRVYVTQPVANAMSIIDVDTRRPEQRIDFDIGPDKSRKTLLSGAIPDSSIPVGVLLSGDGKTIFVAHTNAHVVSLWDASTLEFIRTIETGLEPDGMAWSALDVEKQ